MGLRDDVRHRRHEKIKLLLEEYAASERQENKVDMLQRQQEQRRQGERVSHPRLGNERGESAYESHSWPGHEREASMHKSPPRPGNKDKKFVHGSHPWPEHEREESVHESHPWPGKKRKQVAAEPKRPGSQGQDEMHLMFPEGPSASSERGGDREEISDDPHDPEVAWKRNPNPWVSWEEETVIPGGKQSYVRQTRTYDDSSPPRSGWRRFLHSLRWKTIVALLAFGVIYAMFQTSNDLALRGQQYVKQALTQEIDFAAAAMWYKQAFAGAPSFIPMFRGEDQGAVGVNGVVRKAAVVPIEDASLIRTFAETLNGIELSGSSEAPVAAAETGRVIMVTEESILIQHANNRVTIYGKLGRADVAVNDWVEAGDIIGKLQEGDASGQSLFYFSVKQGDRYMDPLDVITLD
ncbi:hypothetical protein PAT3040_03342 [Paenibacillus agaridevorans]|uniref:M23ase beta-sheet core domain-containing protein n=1 Tax=Paenibacillus agaridevorans TaxID=171404 RepID=A0A2R5EQ96_9BACL|nr:M23 family metallopeptidase [Paenibacillus agaridevorans]GBG08747.1 hypothetical protein PAT3040_03342 [Paenibacillus agaridevorans]